MAITSIDVTCEKKILQKYEPKSPYLTSERVQLLSQVTEKRFFKKKTLDYVSSFPLAANLYKTNSDEFKSSKRGNKKIKKSVLTLPNQPAPAPQVCTVSDMNDSEYYSQSNGNGNKPRIKKRSGIKNVRKPRVKSKELGFYDRDERSCSVYNVNFDSSSTEILKKYKGDGRKASNLVPQKGTKSSCLPSNNEMKPHDVWAVLRSLNRFPFRASPPMSEESIVGTKKKKFQNKRINSKDARVYETKEFAYISSYEVDNNSRSLSQSSSYDRVTVIDKQDEFSTILCKQFEDKFLKMRISKDSNGNKQIKNKPKKKSTKKHNLKSLVPAVPKDDNVECVQLKHEVKFESQNDQKYEKHDCSTTIEDDAQSSMTTTDNNSLVPAKESFIHSENSGSSKAEFPLSETNKLTGKSICGRDSYLKVPSRLNLSKTSVPIGQITIKRPERENRKPRLVTTMPSGCMMPKLTQADIKRRIAAMRFPVIILGREQVNSSVERHDYDPPQFSGLNEHVWPFMTKWCDNKMFESQGKIPKKTIEVTNFLSQLNNKPDICNPVTYSKKVPKCSNEVLSNNKSKYGNNDLFTNKYDTELKKNALNNTEIIPKRQPNKNQKSITLLKDKMLNFLFQKRNNENVVPENYNINPTNIPKNDKPITCDSAKKFDASTEVCTEIGVKSTIKPKTQSVGPSIVTRVGINRNKSPPTKIQQNKFKYPWAKVKRVNDFIESVIKKIATGVYYSHERYLNRNLNIIDAMDISMQTDNDTTDHIDILPKVTVMKKQTRNPIPGFETSLPGLEIKTLNMNQIAVKHCVTNIMMQFDVTVPNQSFGTVINTKTLPIMPVEVTESHTKIFKCKTTIVNAMLPAELCSILPKLMKLIDSDIKSVRPIFCSGLFNKTQSHLSPICEMATRASDMSTTPNVITKILKSQNSPLDHLSLAVKTYVRGMFSYRLGTNKRTAKLNSVVNYNCGLPMEMLPKLPLMYTLTYSIRQLEFKESKFNIENQAETELTEGLPKQCHACTALEVYSTKSKRLVPAFKPFNFEATIIDILSQFQALPLKVTTSVIQYHDSIMYVSIALTDEKVLKTDMALLEGNTNVKDQLSLTESNQPNTDTIRTDEKCVECVKHSTKHGFKIKDQKSVVEYKDNTKNKRKGFYKLYRKCKSATTIPSEKSNTTPLHQIQNLEDFFVVLGSKKILASVFDSNAEKNILSYVGEMRNWITDINPKQALLLLLLTNKKNTPNLVRFRPILLQGIAVNRITRATELDMEIEVIERENLNKIRDASDYQKPFDESSERLLTSLLEKRKKLNPSYLRVMARYVGLGLLKQPTKK